MTPDHIRIFGFLLFAVSVSCMFGGLRAKFHEKLSADAADDERTEAAAGFIHNGGNTL